LDPVSSTSQGLGTTLLLSGSEFDIFRFYK
jgi:hypothetical protein